EPAIESGRFFVMYQPVVDSHTKEIISAEALVRWRKPDGNLISPGVFVPVFEKNGFISRLDLFVWEQVCAFQAKRKAQGRKTVPVSVNLSRVDFYNENLFEDLNGILEKYDIDSSMLKVEITESAYMDQPDVIIGVVEKFRNAGFRILMDDFGSGFSSFNMLKDFEVDILKIDMKFMDSIDTSERAGNILYSIIQMAKAIHMETVAEGVETDTQYELLRNMDCDCIQGYYFHRPLIESDFTDKLDENVPEISSENIGLYDRILLVTQNPGHAGEIFEVMDHQADIHVAGTALEAEEYLKKNFATLQLIMVDYESIPVEFVKIIDFTEEKKFYSDIPLVIIAKTENVSETQGYIGRGATDAIRSPFEKNVVKQRLRRLIDFYGMQMEKRTINVLKKSMMLRQQLNSFFEDSIAGIARVILDKEDDYAVKEVSYFNERYLELHGVTPDQAIRAQSLDEFLPNIRYSEVDSFSRNVYEAIERKAQYFSREYDIEKNDGSIRSCLAACSLLYLGSDVKMDFVLLERTSGAEERAMDIISAICARANDRMNMRVFRYYLDDDILDRFRRKDNGEYARELTFDAEKNLLAEFNVKKDSREYDIVKDMIKKLKSGYEEVSRNILLYSGNGENAERNWYNLSFNLIKGASGRRCALGIIEDISRGTDIEHLLWTHNQYRKYMETNSTFYLEADITDNRVMNPEAFEKLAAYGLPEGFTYDEFVTIFDMTVAEKDIEQVRSRFERATLLRNYNEGKDEQRFTFLSKTLEVPEWREYEALLLMEVNPGNGHLEIGIRLKDTSEQ
ncbi:MAG: EAL domain-containing protein, partial [Lachnospiraceae bacterium]|nr:EAL domain-containing protein [Lachnospiraceae bacterium]